MRTSAIRSDAAHDNVSATDVLRGAGRILWHTVRIPAYTFLVILEPIVRVVFATLALLGVLITFFFKLVGPPTFPFWTMLMLSTGFGLALAAYYGLIRLFSR
jgi:hypothetical protein